MANDFDLLLYEFIKDKPENIRLSAQVINRWYNVVGDYFLKTFSENLEMLVCSGLANNMGWHTVNAMTEDRYSKSVKFSIWKDSWGGSKVVLVAEGTYLSHLCYGISKDKGALLEPRLQGLREKMKGTSNDNWEFWLIPKAEEWRHLSWAEGLININKAPEYWAKTLIDLAHETDKVFATNSTIGTGHTVTVPVVSG